MAKQLLLMKWQELLPGWVMWASTTLKILAVQLKIVLTEVKSVK
jgi:hypothetical protein